MAQGFVKIDDLPQVIPVFPLDGAVLLARGQLPLNIFEPRYVAMIDHALAGRRLIGMVQPSPDAAPGAPSLCAVGCLGRLTAFMETGDGRYLVTLTGISRFRLVDEVEAATPFRQWRIDTRPFAGDFGPDGSAMSFDRERLLDTLRDYLDANNLSIDWDEIDGTDDETLVNSLSMAAPYGVREKQALLEAGDMSRRAELLIAITERQLGAGESDDGPMLQ